MGTQTKKYNPLRSISEQQWLKLIKLLTENVLALNSRRLSKIELLYADGGHYPAAYFRLTSVLDEQIDKDSKKEVSGFVFGFNNEWDDDVYIHPLTAQGYQEDWLVENGITSFFTYHEVGVSKLHKFLDQELRIWNANQSVNVWEGIINEWRLLWQE
ncbi:hypothetical protein [Mucilaginibacter jinjuensis]|uniref:Uncharacterized protein n=1 Tax=Mucilaginibacter jinjuensis TaxID=1176721 RepID=A0ABY7TD51_9SPHI|nr:hypothetical protein [Mucilaginibacter jinjuensis]WCT14386.1 hypothetical protein PQO05_10620 [Mucilaginibacter jinjuensis]